jgi:hypothetical protein
LNAAEGLRPKNTGELNMEQNCRIALTKDGLASDQTP